MDFCQGDGYASVVVDATQDQRNIWWALIRREVTAGLDLDLLSQSGYELRVEAKIRSSHAPRRVNLHLRTQRTVDNHSHLIEYDIPDTTHWHTITLKPVSAHDVRSENARQQWRAFLLPMAGFGTDTRVVKG